MNDTLRTAVVAVVAVAIVRLVLPHIPGVGPALTPYV